MLVAVLLACDDLFWYQLTVFVNLGFMEVCCLAM